MALGRINPPVRSSSRKREPSVKQLDSRLRGNERNKTSCVSAHAQAALLDGAPGYSTDEPIKKKIVRDRHRDAGDQGAGHDLAPVEDVAADEIGRHAERDRLLIG